MKRVLCVGSVTADVIVKPAESLPPAGTLKAVERISAHVGGCAINAAIDLARLGVPSAISCRIGSDCFGNLVSTTLAAENVNTDGLVVDSGCDTTVSVVCLAESGERSFLYNPGSAAVFTDSDVPDSLLEAADIVFVAGALLLPAFDGAPAARLLAKARKMGKFTVMDTAWDFRDIWMPSIAPSLPHLDLFMPSYDEAVKLVGFTEPLEIANELHRLGTKNVIIKLGSQGALFLPENGKPFSLPAYKGIKAVDSTGAGDSFCAGFICGLANGWDFERSGRLANAVGAHCVTAVGATTGIVSLEKTLKFMDEHR